MRVVDAWVSGVEGLEVVFRLADPGHDLAGVRLDKDRGLGGEVEFAAVERGWELRIPRPPVHRMEYKFELSHADGTTTSITDPPNPLVVGGPFGEKSWLAMPGYTAPGWVDIEPVPSAVVPLELPDTAVGAVDAGVWAPEGTDGEELPLLVAHDGPEFATCAGLTHWAGAMVACGKLRPFRLVLVAPGERDLRYGANADYAKALTGQVLPAVTAAYACAPGPVLIGASLGALAALHAEWSYPGTFAGLFLQSGSFFTPATDPQESGFSRFAEVTSFVETVLTATGSPTRAAIAMTCGTCEENAHNNRVLAARLRTLGLETRYDEGRDMHTFTGWRDVLDPGLTGLLQRLWRPADGP